MQWIKKIGRKQTVTTSVNFLEGNSHLILNPSVKEEVKRTIIVLGCARGGTSLVAGALRELGIMMGEHFDGVTHEDIDFRIDDIGKLKELIAERNRNYDVWGWKYPKSIEYMADIVDCLKNPRFIAVYRNPLDIIRSNLNREPELTMADTTSIVSQSYSKINSFVSKSKHPILCINFENSCEDPISFTRVLANFVDVQPNVAGISKFVQKGGYSMLSSDTRDAIEITRYHFPPEKSKLIRDYKVTAHNVEKNAQKFQGKHDDPQFLIELGESKFFKRGISLSFVFESTNINNFKIYFDFGNGFSELSTAELDDVRCGQNYYIIQCDKLITRMRIDPIDSSDFFQFEDLLIGEIQP